MPITNLDDIQLTGEIVLTTAPGMGKYRTFTMPHHTDADDRIHLISSYNEQWNQATGEITKDAATKASFHFSTESDWQDSIELNFDHTLIDDTSMRRILGMMVNVNTGLAHWVIRTDPGTDQSLYLGELEPTVAEWKGSNSLSAVRFVVRNDHPVGGALYKVQNSGNATGHVQMTGAQSSGTIFGLPNANVFCVYGDTETVMGTAGAHPLYFATGTTVRGGINEDGAWFQRRAGVDHPIPHDAVPWSVLRPWKAGEYYQTQVGGQRAPAALGVNCAYAAEFAVPRATTLNSIAIEVTTAAAGSTVRLGLYADNGTGAPGALVADFGTVDSSTTGSKVLAISRTLQPGLYWAVAAARGGAPVIQGLSGGGSGTVPQPLTGTAVHNGYVGTHPADALSATFTPATTPTTAAAPLILVRIA